MSAHNCELKHAIRQGEEIILKCPDGNMLKCVAQIEMLCPNPFNVVSLLLPQLTTKDCVTAGTEVWSLSTVNQE